MSKAENNGEMMLIAKTTYGLEELLAKELLQLGARDIKPLNRAVSFVGDLGFIYKANICLRTALRILIPIASFKASNEESLYKEIKKIDWEKYMTITQTLTIDTVLSSDYFTHSQFVSQKAKDAIVDRFRERYNERPSVNLEEPDLRLNLYIFENECTLSIDSSGQSLHKRGYRDKTNLAPINEVLAAGIVMHTGWDKRSTFIDPMCGSGTILIEAGLMANNIPPGYFRDRFGFESWTEFLPFNEDLFNKIFDSAINRISDHKQELIGNELSPNVSKKAKENVKLAKVDDIVKVTTGNIADFIAPVGKGIVVCNPPYGERMDKDDIFALYQQIGDAFKKNFSGYDCWVISSNIEALKHIGLRPSRKIKLYNGPLECRLMKYEMYKGTKKLHKLKK